MRYKSKRSNETDIPKRVKLAVMKRDNGKCVICWKNGFPDAHFIARSQGGLGVEENIVTLCRECHRQYDNGCKHEEYYEYIKKYLSSKYENWSIDNLIFKKWNNFEI